MYLNLASEILPDLNAINEIKIAGSQGKVSY